jgi:hypothetical protein
MSDAAFLYVTAALESSFRDVVRHPGSSATGYFGLTSPTRTDFTRATRLPFNRSLLRQAEVAAWVYRSRLRDLHRKPSKILNTAPDPLINTLLNLRYRYVSGMGSTYLTHPHVVSAIRKMKPYMPFITTAGSVAAKYSPQGRSNAVMGDLRPPRLTFMHPTLEAEYTSLPQSVRDGIDWLCSVIVDGNMFVSSIESTYLGTKRTTADGPSHASGHAIDVVPTPFSEPVFRDQEGKPRSHHFNWNQELINALSRKHESNPAPCCIALESDHLHLDDLHDAGIYTYSSHRASYANDAVHNCNKHKLVRVV